MLYKNIISKIVFFENECHSPDRNGILFVFLVRKLKNVEEDVVMKNKNKKIEWIAGNSFKKTQKNRQSFEKRFLFLQDTSHIILL